MNEQGKTDRIGQWVILSTVIVLLSLKTRSHDLSHSVEYRLLSIFDVPFLVRGELCCDSLVSLLDKSAQTPDASDVTYLAVSKTLFHSCHPPP